MLVLQCTSLWWKQQQQQHHFGGVYEPHCSRPPGGLPHVLALYYTLTSLPSYSNSPRSRQHFLSEFWIKTWQNISTVLLWKSVTFLLTDTRDSVHLMISNVNRLREWVQIRQNYFGHWSRVEISSTWRFRQKQCDRIATVRILIFHNESFFSHIFFPQRALVVSAGQATEYRPSPDPSPTCSALNFGKYRLGENLKAPHVSGGKHFPAAASHGPAELCRQEKLWNATLPHLYL